MKFTVERDALAEAVAWVARALPGRPVIAVLGGLLVRADGDGLMLSCFDYEVSARMRVPAEVAEPGTVLVPGRLLVEITRSLPGLPVSFADDPDGVSMICGEAAFTLATLPSGEYPDLPDLPQLAGTADGGVLATAISQVAPAASRDDTLPMLTAVNLELAGETMTLAATDRYRLAVRDLTWAPAPDGPGGDKIAVLVPAKTLADAGRMMTPGEPVRIMLRAGGHDGADAMIGFDAGDRRLTTRLLAGEFIRYRSRFPEEFGSTADLPAEAFTEAVRRVSLVAERGTPVQLAFGPGRVTVGAATQGQARARETVPAEFTGGEPVIAFSPAYLLDGMIAATAGAEDGTRVRLRFTSASKPAVITPSPPGGARTGTGFRYLVVPQRVQQLAGVVRPGRAHLLVVEPVPGEQQGGQQPEHHGQDQQRQRGEPARPVRRRGVSPLAVQRREAARRPGQGPQPRQVGHDPGELAVRPGGEHRAKTVVQLVKGQPAGYVVLAQVRRRGVPLRVPDAQHVRCRGPERFTTTAAERLAAAAGVRSVVTHRHRASPA
jgi:DNA polymerase-3 subunit beta